MTKKGIICQTCDSRFWVELYSNDCLCDDCKTILKRLIIKEQAQEGINKDVIRTGEECK